ncbi:histidine kinase N-terminal domain-containing protein [Pseudonocardia sp. KRD-184]|uniref:histidine kinase n=1 Tax=Pseudonocardia oceani TaxID=2792013 RepID=A0ABS6U6B6_9PSEU|nr:PAS domain-containing sensor histidine kinase [Pseudonocardia oceani]MBW0090919.1 histidine kinase N-terminal domain-containing protein [Pseudonocardia oceani]MBW0098046.1 histidine kinase N-terminal domain-containing protein [Pseudonocardia oceani]MBW0110624.1 histidine kinase N-terminal domain-containing protein [Pseudonocardia oceani]MBW0123198.1 histidine kinase N-terminal domain-containing protein [Pseudonocardia oceani]MBW0127745.1 histidine kinase N-terminal domain-containing protein
MSTLSELLAEHTQLAGDVVEHLQRVVAEWQLLADMSFADFLLWVPLESDFLCVAQARPTTAPTAHGEDMVARRVPVAENPQLRRAVVEGRICRDEDPRWHLEVPVRTETIPVRHGGAVVAVLSRDTNLAMPRVPSPLEIAYLGSASDLCQMVADGTFPPKATVAGADTSPRAGDGLVRLDAHGLVAYASPNALSAYHRMGHASDLVGLPLDRATRALVLDPFDAAEVAGRIESALAGRHSLRMEIRARGAVMLLRALPLRPRGDAAGALVLVRDITDLRRRDMALLSKDATIREIHHRVKNNLQTVAALLRLQARRTAIPEARRALAESVRRVDSIALVHETLSASVAERVDLDELVDKVLPAIGDGATAESRAKVRRDGSFGELSAELATPLVLVLTELVHNALAHAFEPGRAGEVVVTARRTASTLDVGVLDDGVGLPPGFDVETADGLGLQIVRTLLDSELDSALQVRARAGGGTEALIRLSLRGR